MLNILVIDDSLTIRKMLEKMLTDLGFNVIATAKSAQEGISLYKEYRPDFVTMDVNMPEMSGIEALKIIRDEYKNANIVMLTSKGDDALVVQAIKYGAKGYILKPPSPSKLKDSIVAVFPKEFEKRTLIKKELDVQGYESTIKDTLTDFYTVEYMHNTIQHLIAVHNKDKNYSICMVLIDISNLDKVYETHGAMQRDVIMAQIADVLQDLIDESNIPIKLCNNEFGIFIIGSIQTELEVIAKEIRENIIALKNPMAMKDTVLEISIGIVCHIQNEKLIHFLERADEALDKANMHENKIFILE